jgi:DNA-binding transcriptional regulator YiaG
MPNIAKVLKDEISRISRKEAKAAVAPIRRPSVRVRKDVADLKRQMATMEKANKVLQARLAKFEAAQPVVTAEPQNDRGWISGKGVKSLRKKLGLSQNDFAALVGVSGQAVYQWERKSGMLKLRNVTKDKVFAVRGIGTKEARQRLAEMAEKAAVKKPVKKAKKALSK